jgi:hypothetical protein
MLSGAVVAEEFGAALHVPAPPSCVEFVVPLHEPESVGLQVVPGSRTPAGTDESLAVPSPSTTMPWCPQHCTCHVVAVVTAQANKSPTETLTAGPESPTTSTGVVDDPPVVPLPSSPYWSSPQHFTPPPERTAQESAAPTLIALTPDVSPVTSTGVGELIDPLPRYPLPQHLAPPFCMTAHAMFDPTSIAAARDDGAPVPPIPCTVTGTGELVEFPSPSAPPLP